MSLLSYSEAIRDAMLEEMRKDEKVILLGLDVGAYGGAFGASKGLYKEFGKERVIDMPISEAGYVGAAVGAAATGMRPIAELQFSDWITIASDQLVNQAANMRYMFGETLSIPMVLRAPSGGYTCAAAQHSHMFESWFSFIPGLKVVLPSMPSDAKALLKSAIRDNNPVIFFEHKKLYEFKEEANAEKVIELGKASIKRKGTDVSIISYGYTVHLALEAAQVLEKEGISVEVVDLMTIKPIDRKAITESVKKTSRVLALQETWLTCSVMSEVVSIIMEDAFDYLDAPVKRVGCKDVPMPFASYLEDYVLPSTNDIVQEIQDLMRE